ncbi:Actin-like protein arp8, variant 2 [Trifolium repens]|nr:Actin-like protein arp8, variant 2 [Trifolium repens]
MLLRKLRDSASSLKQRSTTSSSSSSSSSRSNPSHSPPLPLGSFDSLPTELLLKIIRLLDPKQAAKLCIVCKSWRSLVSDNELWAYFLQTHQPLHFDSILFSEINLTSGYPLPIFVNQSPRVSFKQVYGQRERVPPAVVIDGGSGYCKFGWSKDERPMGRTATFLEFGNVETPIYTRLRHFFATVYGRMKVKPSSQPVVVSLPLCHYDDTNSAKASRHQLKEAICSALFDMNVPAVCALNQATLALYAANQTSGIVVNIGFQVTSVVPILNGKVMRKVGVEVVGLGALKLTGFLREKMQQNNLYFESLYTVRTLKENLCYVAYDYEAELLKDTHASFEAIEGKFTLSKERFQTGEILFQPRLAGMRAMSLHHAIALCMDHCHSAELAGGSDWFKTIVLSGGSACLPGLAERLEKELHSLRPPYMSNGFRVIPPPHGADTAWFGAKLIGSLSTFPAPWCSTKKQFRQNKLNRIW